jgi:hypothetical protein
MPPALPAGCARIYLPNGFYEDYPVSLNTTLADIVCSSPLAYLKDKHSNIAYRSTVYLLEDGKEYDLIEPGTLLL